jgi:hypothetical protein
MKGASFNSYNQQVPASRNFYSTAARATQSTAEAIPTGKTLMQVGNAGGSLSASGAATQRQGAQQDTLRADCMKPEQFAKQRQEDVKHVRFRENLESVREITPRQNRGIRNPR